MCFKAQPHYSSAVRAYWNSRVLIYETVDSLNEVDDRSSLKCSTVLPAHVCVVSLFKFESRGAGVRIVFGLKCVFHSSDILESLSICVSYVSNASFQSVAQQIHESKYKNLDLSLKQ